MKKILIGLILMLAVVKAQNNSEYFKSGIITYISSTQVYVSFNSTDGINEDDTLYVKNNEIYVPAIIVDKLSGSSCTGKGIVSNLDIDTKIFANPPVKPETVKVNKPETELVSENISAPMVKEISNSLTCTRSPPTWNSTTATSRTSSSRFRTTTCTCCSAVR